MLKTANLCGIFLILETCSNPIILKRINVISEICKQNFQSNSDAECLKKNRP